MISSLSWVKVLLDYEKKLFSFNFNKPQIISSISALDASQKAIQQIVEKYPPPYVLYVSGGVDSQAMLWAWKKSGIDFKARSAVYNHNLNENDLLAMRQFATMHNIDIEYFSFDLFNFLDSEHDRYAREYYCGSPQFTSFMKLVDLQQEGTAIMSGNFLLPDPTSLHKKYFNHPSKNSISLCLYEKIADKNFIPFYFLYTQDLAFAFTANDYVIQMNEYLTLLGNSETVINPYRASTTLDSYDSYLAYTLKVTYYQSHGFPVLPQYKKLNGFENVKTYFDQNQLPPSNINKLDRLGVQRSNRVFDLLYRNSYENRLSDCKFVIY